MHRLAGVRRVFIAWLALVLLLAGCAGAPPRDEIGALMREGQELFAAKRYDEAIARFRNVTARDGNQWQAFLWLARAYTAKAAWTDAIAAGRRAYELSPGGQDVVPVFAEALFGGGAEALRTSSFKAAIGHFTDYIRLQPSNARAYLNVGRAFLGDKRFADALGSLVKGLTLAAGPERAEFIRQLQEGGLAALAQGEFSGAIGFLREYLKADP
ncbi:MAG: tetratricopeptide repeat protein, partial [Burkholderiales bacterium]|nr:tetratricopeptide repeat protein [Burkholderiales bacterium]